MRRRAVLPLGLAVVLAACGGALLERRSEPGTRARVVAWVGDRAILDDEVETCARVRKAPGAFGAEELGVGRATVELPPTLEERRSALERLIDEEALVQEAFRRGYDRSDPNVSRRIVHRLVEEEVEACTGTDLCSCGEGSSLPTVGDARYAALVARCRARASAEVAPDAVATILRLRASETPAIVAFFLSHECPMSSAYAPEIKRLHADYAPSGIEFLIVYAEPDLSREDAEKHAREFSLPGRVVVDPSLSLAREVGATVVPEVAVLTSSHELLYRGRIDDRFLVPGRERARPTRHELRDALDAVLAHGTIAVPRTDAFGCRIDWSGVRELRGE